MKADILRRLEALERTVDQTSRPPLRLIDVLTLEALDRDEYWSGPEGEIAVLTRIGVPLDIPAGSGIRTIIVDVGAASRDRWHATAGLDDDALEAVEQREILNDRRREKEDRHAKERAVMDAIRNQQDSLPLPPANAYSPVPVERD